MCREMLGRWVSGGKRRWIAFAEGNGALAPTRPGDGVQGPHQCAPQVPLAGLGRRAAMAAQKVEQAIPAAEAGERVAIYAR